MVAAGPYPDWVMLILSNWLIMEEYTDRWLAKCLGCGATALMAAAA